METNNPVANPQPQAEEPKKVNKKAITIAAIVVAVIVVVGLAIYLVRANGSKKAAEAIAVADLEQNDSIALDQYMKAAELGYKSGNRAKLHSAIALYKKGDYNKALDYLKDASIDSEIVDAGRLTLMGDCYANLGKLDEALGCYDKAISASDNNPQVAPFVLVKEANIYREQKKYDKENETYEKIFNKYPEYVRGLKFDIRKYAERAKANAGK